MSACVCRAGGFLQFVFPATCLLAKVTVPSCVRFPAQAACRCPTRLLLSSHIVRRYPAELFLSWSGHNCQWGWQKRGRVIGGNPTAMSAKSPSLSSHSRLDAGPILLLTVVLSVAGAADEASNSQSQSWCSLPRQICQGLLRSPAAPSPPGSSFAPDECRPCSCVCIVLSWLAVILRAGVMGPAPSRMAVAHCTYIAQLAEM